VLVEALRWHLKGEAPNFRTGRHSTMRKDRDYIPLVRPNMYSDLPWELVVPWLFEMFPGTKGPRGKRHAFYDYTKIAGRAVPENYDLTFSYSGIPSNKIAAERELRRGGRVAVVFLLPFPERERQKKHKTGPRKGHYVHPVPRSWGGFKVIDGDVHDIRPFDPGGVFVGLRYKSAAGILDKQLGEIEVSKERRRRKPGKKLKAFVVLVEKINGQMVVVQTPRQTGVEASRV